MVRHPMPLQTRRLPSFRHHYAVSMVVRRQNIPAYDAGWSEAFCARPAPLGVVTNKPAAFTGPAAGAFRALADFSSSASPATPPRTKSRIQAHPACLHYPQRAAGEPASATPATTCSPPARPAGPLAWAVPHGGYTEEGPGHCQLRCASMQPVLRPRSAWPKSTTIDANCRPYRDPQAPSVNWTELSPAPGAARWWRSRQH